MPRPATQLRSLRLLLAVLGAIASTGTVVSAAESLLWPAPGTVFTDNPRRMTGQDWRVTDPETAKYYPEAVAPFLPNPRLGIPTTWAGGRPLRASLILDYWSGHPGTTAKRLRFNDGPWRPLEAAVTGIAAEEAHKTMAQFNPEVDWPVDELGEGENFLEGTAGPNDFHWGQWGWNAVVLRVQLDPTGTPPHPARLVAPSPGAVLPENPVLELAVPEGAPEVREVRFFARHLGPDVDGDGRFDGWQGFFHQGEWQDHVGTRRTPPWRFTWDTEWVPDQPPGSIAVTAQVRDARGVWTVTPIVEGLTLERAGRSVTLHRPFRVMPYFWVRAGKVKSCVIPVPLAAAPERARAARLQVRGWNLCNHELAHTPVRLNCGPWLNGLTGADHGFTRVLLPIDPTLLQGGDNLVTFTSDTEHHGAEILWPGPVLLLERDHPGPGADNDQRSPTSGHRTEKE